jgi:chorismate mutase
VQGSSRRARARLAAAPPSGGTTGGAQICTAETQGLTDFPIQRIAEQVQPDQSQQALLDELKAATEQAVEMLRSACPSDLPSTPTARIAAVRQRVEAMLQALRLVRPAVEKFYASLSDEQKQRFNALDAGTVGTVAAEGQQKPVAQACGQSATRALELPIERVQGSLHLSADQEAALKQLKDASAKAADILAQSCPADQALTPPGRLAAMEQRLAAMLQGLDLVQPALANFYNSLSDEQKAQINRIGPRAA